MAASAITELSDGDFLPVIGDREVDASKVRRVVLCTGKVYHDLAQARALHKIADVALLRVELLYPWPQAAIAAALASFRRDVELVFCQEEPMNMGAYAHARMAMPAITAYAGRRAAASPATGSLQAHKREQGELVARALGQSA